jgi:hypothetical protein
MDLVSVLLAFERVSERFGCRRELPERRCHVMRVLVRGGPEDLSQASEELIVRVALDRFNCMPRFLFALLRNGGRAGGGEERVEIGLSDANSPRSDAHCGKFPAVRSIIWTSGLCGIRFVVECSVWWRRVRSSHNQSTPTRASVPGTAGFRWKQRCASRVERKEAPSNAGPLVTVLSIVSYDPLGGFLPPVATKLTQSPWFLNMLPNVCQRPFLHWSLLVGSAGS